MDFFNEVIGILMYFGVKKQEALLCFQLFYGPRYLCFFQGPKQEDLVFLCVFVGAESEGFGV